MNPFILQNIIPKVTAGGLSPYVGFGWWDPSDGANVTKSSGRFDQVNDKGSGGNNLISSGVNRPFEGRFVNGLEALDFRGAEYMTTTFSSSITQPAAYIIPFISDVNTSFHEVMSGVSTNRQSLFTKYSDGSYFAFAGDNNFRGGTATPQVMHIYTLICNGVSSKLYEDGILKLSTDIGGNGQDGYTLGVRYNLTQFFFNGLVLENFMYNSIPTDAQLNQTGQYLSDKYAIPYTDIV